MVGDDEDDGSLKSGVEAPKESVQDDSVRKDGDRGRDPDLRDRHVTRWWRRTVKSLVG